MNLSVHAAPCWDFLFSTVYCDLHCDVMIAFILFYFLFFFFPFVLFLCLFLHQASYINKITNIGSKSALFSYSSHCAYYYPFGRLREALSLFFFCFFLFFRKNVRFPFQVTIRFAGKGRKKKKASRCIN